MQMLYNSDNFAVVQFDIESPAAPAQVSAGDAFKRGGYEIVDKFARKEIFIDGAMAEQFKLGVEALIQNAPSEDEIDAYLARYAALAQQPVILH
jgi:hypothetical protein